MIRAVSVNVERIGLPDIPHHQSRVKICMIQMEDNFPSGVSLLFWIFQFIFRSYWFLYQICNHDYLSMTVLHDMLMRQVQTRRDV